MSSTDDFISSWVQNDARPLTARLLSRTLAIDLVAARAAMARFLDAHPDEMHATYLLKGTASAHGPARPPPLDTPAKRPRDRDGGVEAEHAPEPQPEPQSMDVDSPASQETMLVLIVSEAKRQGACAGPISA